MNRIDPAGGRPGVFARFMGVVHGDKHMVGAYAPPADDQVPFVAEKEA
jgi:hypothetical protein